MKEFSGDIPLSRKQQVKYMLYNFVRGVYGSLALCPSKFFKPESIDSDNESPSRKYIDAFLRKQIKEHIPKGKISVLDIGCGSGYVRHILADMGYEGTYTGVDVVREPDFSDYEHPAFKSIFVQKPIGKFDKKDAYDLVISNTALEHIADDMEALRVARDACNPSGVEIHLVPAFWSLFLYWLHGYRQYSRRRIQYLFTDTPYELYRMGGVFSFFLHAIFITVPERLIGRFIHHKNWRKGTLYPRLTTICMQLDRYLPWCSTIYGFVRSGRPRKINIIFGLPSFLFGGGIEKQLLKQFALLDRSKFTISLISLFEYEAHRPTMFDSLQPDVSYYRLNFKSKIDFTSWARLYRILKDISPDLVVTSMVSANTVFRIMKLFVPYKIITREHNTYTDKKLYHRILDHILSYLSDSIIAVSNSVADFASRQARIPRNKFVVIHNGVEYDAIQQFINTQTEEIERIRKEFGLSLTKHMMLNVARLKPQKNHILIIDAFKKFQETRKDYVLAIASDGMDRKKLDEYIKQQNLTDSVFLLGYREDVYALFAASKFFVLTSHIEGFPNVGIEAMAFGLPMISTRVSGVDEFIEDGKNGFIVDSTPEDVAEKMQVLASLSDQERERYQAYCYETARRFDIKKVVKEYERHFLSICKKN